MARELKFDFSGWGIELEGEADDWLDRLSGDWAAFLGAGRRPLLRAEVIAIDGPYDEAVYRPKQMRCTFGDVARLEMAEGRGEVRRDGSAQFELLASAGDRGYFTLVNFVRAATAWLGPPRGLLLLHAAGLVVDGRGYVLIGPQDSGKTSWVRHGVAGGAKAISDDLLLVADDAGHWELLGAPFRSTHRDDYRSGRWPLEALLFPSKGREPALRPVSRLLLSARLTANLPFVNELAGRDSALNEACDRLCRVPARELTFALDPGFLELLRGGVQD